jgi:glycosyltransferase involved in cell wall biosynthesis
LQDDFKKEIVVIPNGADPQLFQPQPRSDERRADLGLGQKERVIGFVGSLMPWHGLQDLIDAFEMVSQRDGSVRLMVVGGNRDQIDQLIEANQDKRSLKKIIFLGEIDYPLIPAYLDLCQVLVAPFNTKRDEDRRKLYDKYSFWWCPIKLFEYMAMARPVVVSDVGEIPEYLDGAGLTYREGDTRELAESILRLLNDSEESSRMGQRGRRLILEKYNWELHARRIEQIITPLG